jgi:hypothetical protein
MTRKSKEKESREPLRKEVRRKKESDRYDPQE